jgi:hypothetical protein
MPVQTHGGAKMAAFALQNIHFSNGRYWRILLKKSEGVFCAQFPVEPSLADAAMIQGAYRD